MSYLKIYIILGFAFFCNTLIFAKLPEKLFSINEKANKIYISTNDDIFIKNKKTISKYNKNGIFEANFNSLILDNDAEIVGNNSFKTVIFSPNYYKILLLDNRLKLLETINLNNIPNYNIACVGVAYDNQNLWFFDNFSQQIIKYDASKNQIISSFSLAQFKGKTLQLDKIKEFGVYLYLLDKNIGIIVMDNQGNYIKTIPIKAVVNFTIKNDLLYYKTDEKVFSYNLLSFENMEYNIPNSIKKITLGNTIFAGVNANSLVEIFAY